MKISIFSKENRIIYPFVLFITLITLIKKSLQISLDKNIEMENPETLFIGGKFISPYSDDIKIIGRYHKELKKNLTYFDWSGTTILFNIEGKCDEIYLDLKSNGDYFNIYYNEKFQFKFNLTNENLVKIKPNEENLNIKLIKRTEPLMSGDYVKFGGIYLKGKCNIKPNPKSNKVLVEYIGDSTTCGFGVEEIRNKTASLETSTIVNSFAGILSRKLNTDYYGICASGMGVVRSTGYNGVGKVMQYYNRNYFFDKGNIATNVLTSPDVIVIFLGLNDWIYIKTFNYNEKMILEFIEKFKIFILQVRYLNSRKNGSVPPIIILGLGENTAPVSKDIEEMQEISYKINPWIQQAAEGAGGEKNQIFYRKIYAEPKINFTNDKDYGSGEHWSVSGSEKFANGAYPVFLNITNIFDPFPNRDSNHKEFIVNSTYKSFVGIILLFLIIFG